MKKKGLSKQQLLEKQILDNKKFNRITQVTFGFLLLCVVSILLFRNYGHDTRFLYRRFTYYGKEISLKLVCMNSQNLQFHETSKVVYEGKTYYFCSQECFNHLVNHFQEVAFTTDAYTGDTINKADAVIGLKERWKPQLVYFKNKQNFNKYYESKNK